MNFIKKLSRYVPHLQPNALVILQRGQRQWQLHWLDGLVIVAIIVALGGLLLARSQRQTQWVPVEIEVAQEEWWWQGLGPKYWYLDQLQPGSVSYNSFGSEVAKVEKVELFDVGQGRRRAVVRAQLKVNYDSRSQQYVFEFQPLQVGRGVELSFSKQQLRGVVTAIDRPALPVVERSVRILVSKVNASVAESYHVGLQSLTDDGQVVATITQLKVTPGLETAFSDVRGRMMQVIAPGVVDVSAVIKLRLTQDGNQYYFANDQPVKIGSELEIQFPQSILRYAQVLGWADEPLPAKP